VHSDGCINDQSLSGSLPSQRLNTVTRVFVAQKFRTVVDILVFLNVTVEDSCHTIVDDFTCQYTLFS